MQVRPEGVLVGLVAVVLLVAGAAVLVTGRRDAPERDPDSPDGVVLSYIDAMLDDDADAAAVVLSKESDCDVPDLVGAYHPDSARIVVDDVEVDGAEATVVVEVSDIEGDGPMSSEYTHTERFSLQREEGAWRIVDARWPYTWCVNEGKP